MAKTKRKSDNFNKNILSIPYVTSYKYLGITFEYTMTFGLTLENVTRTIRSMKNYEVLGRSDMSLMQRLQIWKTYFYSRILYTLVILSLVNKSFATKITARIFISFKCVLGLNQKLSKTVMLG